MVLAAASARALAREVMVTSAPSLASSAAARMPTGPVPASTTAFLPERGLALASSATPAAAVVLEPLESSITDTRKGPKNFFFTALSSASPLAMSPPPTKIAVNCFSLPPRVKIVPSTSAPTVSGVTLA